MDARGCRSTLVRLGLQGIMVVVGLSLAGCPQPIPRVSIPRADPSPPTLVWQTYNLLTKEEREIVQDGQSLDVKPSELLVVTLAVEDLHSGVQEVTLNGTAQLTCELGGHVEPQKFSLEPQDAKRTPDHENTVPVRDALAYTVEIGKYGCKDQWRFTGGTVSLVGTGKNFVGGATRKTLQVHVKRQPPEK